MQGTVNACNLSFKASEVGKAVGDFERAARFRRRRRWGGRLFRVDLEKHDRRLFTPWGGPSWKRGCNRRSAMERIYSRVDNAYRHGEALPACSKCACGSARVQVWNCKNEESGTY